MSIIVANTHLMSVLLLLDRKFTCFNLRNIYTVYFIDNIVNNL